MNNIFFEKFDEVEESIRKDAPPTVYKYRADWNNPFHKSLLTERKAWFSAPRELNDPNDVRVPLKFDVTEIEHPKFFEKMIKHFKESHTGLLATESEIIRICENRLDIIRENPEKYFQEVYEQIRQSDMFDRVGVFSCTPFELDSLMWKDYGGNDRGFTVGFDTVELARSFLCSIGKVKYDDEISQWSFIKEIDMKDFDTYFLKSQKWKHEKEFRFYTIQDDEIIDRARVFSKESVKEVLMGLAMPDDIKKNVITAVKSIYGDAVQLYEVKLTSTGLSKFKIP